MQSSNNEGEAPRTPTLSIKDTALGLALTFHAPPHLNPASIGLLLRDEVPIIRRFLDDPVNWPVVGRQPEARRNAFLALFLSIDRVSGRDFGAQPLDRVCDVARHVKGYAGPPCPLCSVLRLLGRLQGEKLIHISSISGETDDKGHYLHAEKIAFGPGDAIESYREKIMRLPLPALLRAAPHTEADVASVLSRLAALPVEGWSKLNLEINPDGFKVGGMAGYPADLGLAQHEWSILCDIAKSGGNYAPKLLGASEAQLRKSVDRIAAALKRAFPRLPGAPLSRTGTGAYETAFPVKTGGKSLDGGW